MLVSVGDALVILFLELVFFSVRIGIATAPEILDEAFALVVGGEFLKCFPFFVGDDVGNVFVEPVFVSLFQFGFDVARLVGRILLLLWKTAGLALRTLTRQREPDAEQLSGKTLRKLL